MNLLVHPEEHKGSLAREVVVETTQAQEGGAMAIAPEKIVVEPGSGRVVSMPSTEAIFKVQGDQTSGAFSIAEIVLQPRSFTPPHLHEKTDEVSYILEGELGVMVAEEE